MVDVGVVLVGVPVPAPVDPAEDVPEDDDPPVAGEGVTIDGVVALVDVVEVVLELEDVLAPVAGAGFAEAGLELSLGTAPANGSRAILANTTLTGSVEDVVAVVVVWALAGVAAGGAGTVGVVLADAPLSRNTGTATTATSSAATTIHSLRSTRSRRSELILVLRSSCRPERPTGRWWR
jgi:hypothetical protein